jgi:Zn2+/Cd2+-exporting ATPase
MIPAAIMLSRATLRTIHQNVAAAIGVKALFLALTMLGLTNLWLAVLADTGMSLLVTMNSLRLALPNRNRA